MFFQTIVSLLVFTAVSYANDPISKDLVRGKNHFIIGVGEYDYLPHTGFIDGKFTGFGAAVLNAFAQSKGYLFEYKSVPVPRMFKVFLDDKSVDFMYPNNSYWAAERQKARNVSFSSPVVAYVDGVLVKEENIKIKLNELKTMGVLIGFDPIQYADLIKDGKIRAHENGEVVGLLKMVLNNRVQGIYLNPLVANYYLKTVIENDQPIYLARGLPFIKSHYSLSTINYPEILKEFNLFLKKEYSTVLKLQKQYGVEDPLKYFKNAP
ncbi:substrate-binding periplasmic protein [Bdellovibrio sp. HCB290]|uniref:substrate-binding periplasmic protein n=1 Tax=Bdellovibrio sp. HCB290 TaxID=3394356 RepID=UPI0039B477A3